MCKTTISHLRMLHKICNDWSLVHLVTNCARAYMAIYMHVCVLIYKKGVDYLCSYITHLKEVHLRYSHIITSPPFIQRTCPHVSDTLHLHNTEADVLLLVGSVGLSAMLAGGCHLYL